MPTGSRRAGRWRHPRLAALAVAAVASASLVAVAVSTDAAVQHTRHWATTAGDRPTAASNLAAAAADASWLLSQVALPAGSSPSATEPAGDNGTFSNPGSAPDTPNLVDDHSWWVVPGSPAAVILYAVQHVPAGSTRSSSGSGQIYEEAGLEWPPEGEVLASRMLIFTATELPGGLTGLRADAEDVWVTPRSASEVLPAGSRLLRVSVQAGNGKQRPLAITSPRRIAAVAAILNSLPALQPGTGSCPADFGVTIRLAFYRRGAPSPRAVANIDTSGCGGVALTLDGREEPELSSEPLPGLRGSVHGDLIQRIDRALATRINTASADEPPEG